MVYCFTCRSWEYIKVRCSMPFIRRVVGSWAVKATAAATELCDDLRLPCCFGVGMGVDCGLLAKEGVLLDCKLGTKLDWRLEVVLVSINGGDGKADTNIEASYGGMVSEPISGVANGADCKFAWSNIVDRSAGIVYLRWCEKLISCSRPRSKDRWRTGLVLKSIIISHVVSSGNNGCTVNGSLFVIRLKSLVTEMRSIWLCSSTSAGVVVVTDDVLLDIVLRNWDWRKKVFLRMYLLVAKCRQLRNARAFSFLAGTEREKGSYIKRKEEKKKRPTRFRTPKQVLHSVWLLASVINVNANRIRNNPSSHSPQLQPSIKKIMRIMKHCNTREYHPKQDTHTKIHEQFQNVIQLNWQR